MTPIIKIFAESFYLPEQSHPDNHHYVFAYSITIENQGQETAKLLRRQWLITDANGKVQKVEGEGVVGEQPELKPGEHFRYTSGTMLSTPQGTMRGYYFFRTASGIDFAAEIPEFLLSVPRVLH
jgi:ApaG protein